MEEFVKAYLDAPEEFFEHLGFKAAVEEALREDELAAAHLKASIEANADLVLDESLAFKFAAST